MATIYAQYPIRGASGGGGGGGTVTSVGLEAASIFTVLGSPITTSGTLVLDLANETANTVFAGPVSGGPDIPTFRALTASDVPSLPYALDSFTIIQTDSGTFPTATSATSVLTLHNADGELSIAGDSTSNTVTFGLNTVTVGKGGTGLTSPGASGNILTSTGSAWASSPSLAFIDSLQNTSGTVSLKGDTASPSASQYYGTDVSSSLGYHTLPGSVTYADSITNTGGTITLVNDSVSPAASQYYGTNASSVLGYFTLPSAGAAITQLTGDVMAVGPGSVSATVVSVGGSTAAGVHSGVVLANNATNLDTASTIVLRDSSGNFSAGTVNANLVGNAAGGNVTVTGGPATTNGGNATLAGSAGNASNGNGGSANITGGAAGGAGGSNESGGAVNIAAGASVGSATGGAITISSGVGGAGTGTAGATGGTTNVNGGTGGAGSATSGNGGGATLKAGSGGGGVGGGAGGTAQVTGGTGGTGSSTGGNGGSVSIQGGGAGSNANAAGGAVTVAGGNGSGTGAGGAGGAITLSTGVAGGDNTQNNTGGSFTVSLGHSMGSSGGPAVQVTAGTGGVGTASTGAAGGNITLTSGAGGVGSSTGGGGGNLILQAGTGGNSATPGSGGFIQFQTGATTALTEHMRITAAGNTTFTNGNVEIVTAGFGLQVAHGANCRLGTATLTAGAVTVSNTTLTTNTAIFLTVQSLGTIAVPAAVAVTAKTVGTSFVITSSAPTDTSVVAWMLVEQI